METVGFIGPGIMGAPMIRNLVGGGHPVRAYGRSRQSRERIAAAGAVVSESPESAVAGADVVITMLPDTPDVQEVMFGENGLADLLSSEQVYVDMSTIRPDVTRDIHRHLSTRGVEMLDAPVSGGEAAAVEGTLSVMAGGAPITLERVRGVLERMAASITHVGPAGSGQLTKAANQLIVAANIQAISEAIVLLESSGANVAQALGAISGGLAGSTVLERKRESFLNNVFDPGFRIELHNKDLGIVRDTADDAGVGLPITALVSQLMAAAGAKGYGGLDHSALLKVAKELNNLD